MYRIFFILGVLCIYLFCFSPMRVEAKVLGYWRFDEKNEIGKDSSGFDNHGEAKQGAVFTVKGKVSGGLQLDGSSWVEVPHHNSLNAKNQVTLMCWVNFDAAGVAEAQEGSLIYKNGPIMLEGDQKNRRFWTSYSLFKYRERKQQGSFAFEANTAEGRTLTAPGFKNKPEPGKWYHVAGVADGTKARLYVNAKEEAIADQKGDFKPTEQPLTIGFDLRVNPKLDGSKPYVIGIIDEAIVLDKALTSGQVKEAMDLGKARKALDRFEVIWAVEPADKLATKWGEIKVGR